MLIHLCIYIFKCIDFKSFAFFSFSVYVWKYELHNDSAHDLKKQRSEKKIEFYFLNKFTVHSTLVYSTVQAWPHKLISIGRPTKHSHLLSKKTICGPLTHICTIHICMRRRSGKISIYFSLLCFTWKYKVYKVLNQKQK